ncbi:hypothetical protein PV08_02284 [Exophiala spinifera]|uniref:Carboxylesterase type B domain-containing protein n=1 Tax=Exophiala spinifera TaxID=91928 RepID=A0A0D1ZZA5_9EURO|nr:uncharacterized protein PV08_02284 [Exophiala spinifera]KIW17997.1 hypothetical protein PV08_02284 [Exophiala spinifera]
MFSSGIALLLVSSALAQGAPTVKVLNGTYEGFYSPEFSQEQFLGIPYVQPPLGDLRLRNPHSLNTTWDDVRSAVSYGPSCLGLNQSEGASEDCLNLNIVRPTGISNDSALAVAVWIFGGGFVSGSNSLPTYNLSNFVQTSQEMGTPVIAVSINYRLHCWGYMWSKEIKDEGVANLGFKDQRLALHWIQEITIFGESAGGNSVGTHLIAYGGRDDKLFRAAISQSGAPSTYYRYQTADEWQPFYDAVVYATGCTGEQDTLACLRTVDSSTLYDIFNDNDVVPARTSIYSQDGPKFVQVIDGDFVEESATTLMQAGKFVHVPYMLGGNKDESATFAARGINNTEEFLELVIGPWEVSDNATAILAALYPDIPGIGSPEVNGTPPAGLGHQFRRSGAFQGDVNIHAPRRLANEIWAASNTSTYGYVFDSYQPALSPWVGSNHGAELPFVFGSDWIVSQMNSTYAELSKAMQKAWISFVATLDPNHHLADDQLMWPEYTGDEPEILLFAADNTSVTTAVQPDTYRAAGIKYVADNLDTEFGH